MARERGTAVLAFCHATKDDDYAGPRTVEHDVDGLIRLEPDADMASIVWWVMDGKYRFGPVPRRVALMRTASGAFEEVTVP